MISADHDNQDAYSFTPTSCKRVFTVENVYNNLKKGEHSNWGKCVNIYAHGTNIPVAKHVNCWIF